MKRKFSLIILNLIQIISSIYIFAKPNLLDSIVYTYMEGEGGPAALLAGTMIFWFSIFSIILSGIIIFEVFKNDENKFQNSIILLSFVILLLNFYNKIFCFSMILSLFVALCIKSKRKEKNSNVIKIILLYITAYFTSKLILSIIASYVSGIEYILMLLTLSIAVFMIYYIIYRKSESK